MDKINLVAPILIIIMFAVAIGCGIFLTSAINSVTKITDNKIVTGVFEKLEIKGSDVTIYFKNYTSVTFSESESLQVPFVVGHIYQLTLAVHGTGTLQETYLTLQSVVEIPT